MKITEMLSVVSGKALTVVFAALMTLLASSLVLNYYTNEAYKEAIDEVNKLALINVSLNQAISSLQDEVTKRPTEYITITREVESELCKGKAAVDKVMDLPNTVSSKEKGGNTDVSTKVYVDIDAELPADLVRLLNEDD